MTAEQRGSALLHEPIKSLPPLALEFAKKLCSEIGMCMEVALTAYTIYAQCVEGLPCTDALYQASPVDIAWFDAKKG